MASRDTTESTLTGGVSRKARRRTRVESDTDQDSPATDPLLRVAPRPDPDTAAEARAAAALPEKAKLHDLKPKVEPGPPTDAEKEILDLLESEYARADSAAKAAARFERDVHQRFVDARLAEGYPPEEAGNINRVFRARDFTDAFNEILLLRLRSRLIQHLGLDTFHDPIMQRYIEGIGTRTRSATKQVTVDSKGKIFYGEEDAFLEQQKREEARRRAGR